MAEKTSIEWTATINADGSVTPGATWNPITGCSVMSPGCTNCYAMRLAGTRLRDHPSRAGLTRDTRAGPVWTGEVRLNEQWLDQPLRWRKPRNVFVCAHGDLFHESVPDEWIDRVFATMALAPQHLFQVLTKRPARARGYLETAAPPDSRLRERQWPLRNVHIGVSVEDQARATGRLPDLVETPAALRWVSAEPLLGPLDLRPWFDRIGWVVVGGESGLDARSADTEWMHDIVIQCCEAGVPVFVKQLGSRPVVDGRPLRLGAGKGGDPAEWPHYLRMREMPR